MEKWKFGIDNNYLIDLVLKNKKTATTSIYENGASSVIGTKSKILYDNDKTACTIRVVKSYISKFIDVKWELAVLEGENANLEQWRMEHKNYFCSIDDSFSDETLVEIEVFEVLK